MSQWSGWSGSIPGSDQASSDWAALKGSVALVGLILMLLPNGQCVYLVPDDWSKTPSRWSQLGPFLLIRSCVGCEYSHEFYTLAKTKPLCFCSILLLAHVDLSVSFSLSLPESNFGYLPTCLVLFPLGFFLYRDLSNNQISELASDAFQGLRSLNSLWVTFDTSAFQCT